MPPLEALIYKGFQHPKGGEKSPLFSVLVSCPVACGVSLAFSRSLARWAILLPIAGEGEALTASGTWFLMRLIFWCFRAPFFNCLL